MADIEKIFAELSPEEQQHLADLIAGTGQPTRPMTMEQDPEVIALAKKIYLFWTDDERWLSKGYPIAYFWAELAAKVALRR